MLSGSRVARAVFSLLLAGTLVCGVGFAQQAISAKAGMVNVADGDVYLVDAKGGQPTRLEPKPAELIDLKEGQTLKTAEGRTEVLLTPGAFLRMAESSSFKLLSNRLSDVRLEMLTGSALIEAVEMIEDNHVAVLNRDAVVSFSKAGLYRFDAEPARIRVYTGEAVVEYGGQRVTLKSGKGLLAGERGWTVEKFDPKDSDALYRWAKRRSGYLAMANVSAARQSRYANGLTGGSWVYNPYFGFATYLPYGDTLRNPFGYYYYTPSTVISVYYPRPAQGGGYSGNAAGFASSTRGRDGSAVSSHGGWSGGANAAAVASPVSSGGSGRGGSVSGGGGGAASAAPASSGRGGR